MSSVGLLFLVECLPATYEYRTMLRSTVAKNVLPLIK